MEIINVTLIEAGIPTFYLIMSIILWVIALVALGFAIWCWIESEGALGFQMFLICCGAIVFGLGCFFANRVKEPYNKYDVILTGEEVNLKEFAEKYNITGRDGNIWHIEDRH